MANALERSMSTKAYSVLLLFHQIESNANELIQIEIEIEDAFVDLRPNVYFWQKAKIY